MTETEGTKRDLMTISEVVAITGLSKATVCRLCKRGDLRAARVGRRWLIARASVDELLAPALG